MKIERLKKAFTIKLSDEDFDPNTFLESEDGDLYMIIGFPERLAVIEMGCGEVFELDEINKPLAIVDFKLVEVYHSTLK